MTHPVHTNVHRNRKKGQTTLNQNSNKNFHELDAVIDGDKTSTQTLNCCPAKRTNNTVRFLLEKLNSSNAVHNTCCFNLLERCYNAKKPIWK